MGTILKEQLIKFVLKEQRVSNKIIKIKVEVEGERLNIVHAPQVECNLKEKQNFWSSGVQRSGDARGQLLDCMSPSRTVKYSRM